MCKGTVLGLVWDDTFPDMPCMKRVYRDKKASVIVQQPGRTSASRPVDEPVVNRGFCSSIGLHRISLVRASGESLRRRIFDALEGTREARPQSEQFCWHPVLPDPAPPLRRVPRPDPFVVCPGFGFENLPKRIGGVLVGIQDRRALFMHANKPRINRMSTAHFVAEFANMLCMGSFHRDK